MTGPGGAGTITWLQASPKPSPEDISAMTNTLHRLGSVESLSRDYVMLAMATQGVNEKGAAPKLRKMGEIVASHGPANMGDEGNGGIFTGVPLGKILDGMRDGTYLGATFVEAERLVETLRELKSADTGMSVVVSAPFEQTFDAVLKAGLKAHTVHMSLGVFGKKGLLPPQKVLEVVTMCGHGMVCPKMVQKLATKVSDGEIEAKAAGEKLASTCTCGIFNPVRAAAILAGETSDAHR